MKKISIALAFVFALLLAPRFANATYGYVCSVGWSPSPASQGSYGSASASFYTGTQCTGTYLFNLYVCSTGYSDSNCSQWAYDAAGFNNIVSSLRAAASTNQKLWVSSTNYVLQTIFFYSAGF
jgi:hypothetical protein